MNTNGSSYTFGFATVIVVTVAVLLSLAAIGLGPYQEKNIKAEKMQNILSSIGINSEPKEAEHLFNKYIKKTIGIKL